MAGEISPELMEKLSKISRLYIRQFYDYHKEADESLEKCDAAGVTQFLYAQRSRAEAIGSLIRDSIDKRIDDDERGTIIDRMHDFEEAKRSELFDALEKCGCRFKE